GNQKETGIRYCGRDCIGFHGLGFILIKVGKIQYAANVKGTKAGRQGAYRVCSFGLCWILCASAFSRKPFFQLVKAPTDSSTCLII
ncbi:MAG: hypothetical protein V4615_13200, partial [Bacteroidota bacterium]